MTNRILETAANIVLMPGAWTQGCLARNESGRKVKPELPSAVCFCAFGAIQRAGALLNSTKREMYDANNLAYDNFPIGGVMAYNDKPGRTAEQVAAKLLKAAHAG